jgi:hypothetical protein
MDRQKDLALGAGAATTLGGAFALAAWRDRKLREFVDNKPVSLQKFDPTRITADPESFQFKGGGDAAGVTERLRGVSKWDPVAAGKAVVFERVDGTLVIADGHQRLGLAKRVSASGQQARLDGYLFRERDGWTPKDVRAYAALKNIKELSGAALDMAKVIRERPDLVDGSVPMSDAKIKEAMSLSKLSPKAFNMVAGGVIRPELAVAVGDVADTARHASLIGEMVKADVGTIQQARLYVGQAMAAPNIVETNLSLFGEEIDTRSLVSERTAVLDKALSVLKSDRKVFATLEREASRIEDAGNKLARHSNAARAESAGQLNALVEKLATRHGPVSSMLDEAARGVAGGEQPGVAARKFVETLTARARSAGGLNALLTGETPAPAPAIEPAPKGQGSLLPEPTTREKVAAQAKAMEVKGRIGDPADQGLFSSSRDQTDLVDQAKAAPQREPRKPTADPLKGLKKAQLQAVAKEISAPAGGKLTVAQLRDGINAAAADGGKLSAVIDKIKGNGPAGWSDAAREASASARAAIKDSAGNEWVKAPNSDAWSVKREPNVQPAAAATSAVDKAYKAHLDAVRDVNADPKTKATNIADTRVALQEAQHAARAPRRAALKANAVDKLGGKLGVAGIAAAAFIAYDATKQQAEAAGVSTADARVEGGKAAVTAGGIAAAVGLGITKAVQAAGPMIGGIVAKAFVPGTVAFAAATRGREGYESGGLPGAGVETGKATLDYISGGLLPLLNTKARELLLPNDGQDRTYHAPRSGKAYLNAAAAEKAAVSKPIASSTRRAAAPAPSTNGWVQEYTRNDGTRVASYKRV